MKTKICIILLLVWVLLYLKISTASCKTHIEDVEILQELQKNMFKDLLNYANQDNVRDFFSRSRINPLFVSFTFYENVIINKKFIWGFVKNFPWESFMLKNKDVDVETLRILVFQEFINHGNKALQIYQYQLLKIFFSNMFITSVDQGSWYQLQDHINLVINLNFCDCIVSQGYLKMHYELNAKAMQHLLLSGFRIEGDDFSIKVTYFGWPLYEYKFKR